MKASEETMAPSPYFSQVFILKIVKVLCFDTLLQVFILKVVSLTRLLTPFRLAVNIESAHPDGKIVALFRVRWSLELGAGGEVR